MGRYFYHKEDDKLFIRMQGRMKYTSSVGFDLFIADVVTDDVGSILVDLQQVDYIDSTNLGLIAKLAEFLNSRGRPPLMILSTREEINEVLSSLGFDQMCTILGTAAEDMDYDTVPVKTGSEKQLMTMMIDAHKRLVAMSEDNASVFKDVVELMEQDLGGQGT
ncbi:MAG: STAS domain-containing protein [Spirochaetales bacterium]|nr:STAS domain-containing protein [Spirochaetales bacterium]